jgi:hypothetical protein
MLDQEGSEIVSKLDAARRQLATAIELWFHEKDQVSILALSFAAYEVIHSLSKKQGRVQPLIFDTKMVPRKFRQLLSQKIKKVPNFFKHADQDDPSETVELKPAMAEIFFVFSLVGLSSMSIPNNDYESAFWLFFLIHKPTMITEFGREMIAKNFPVDTLSNIREWPKSEFLEIFLQAKRMMLPIDRLM